VWNTLTSPAVQMPNIVEVESSGGESEQRCFMLQGNDSLEVYSKTQLDDSFSSSCNECMDAHASNYELVKGCERLILKNKVLKKNSSKLKEENKNLSSRLDLVLQERDEILIERDSLKSQLDLVLNENKILINKNDCNDILNKNETLTSKLDFVLKENNSLKKKLI